MRNSVFIFNSTCIDYILSAFILSCFLSCNEDKKQSQKNNSILPIVKELKANQALASANEVQLVNYLTATGIEIGLLLNFGAARLEFRRKTRTYRPKRRGQDAQDLQDFRL